MFGRYIILLHIWNKVKYYLDLYRATKGAYNELAWGMIQNFLSCSLQRYTFNFCMPISFLKINIHNHSHHLKNF